MILVDIGNTSIYIASVKKDTIISVISLPRGKCSLKKIRQIIAPYPGEEIFICSVVPSITKLFKRLKRKVSVVGEDIKVPLRCHYNKKNIGMDRLIGAFAATKLFPQTRLIIDFGTAITFDFLSETGAYLGGLILPGVGSTLKVLSSCAMLPHLEKITLKKVNTLVPKDTRESIVKGIQEGFSNMIDSLVKKYRKELKLSPRSIPLITGGDAPFIIPHINFSYLHEPLLVIKGLYWLSKKFQ